MEQVATTVPSGSEAPRRKAAVADAPKETPAPKELPAIEVKPDPRWALACSLRSIDKRLKNAHVLAERLKAEGAPITPEQYFARLRKRRKELQELLAKERRPPRPLAGALPQRSLSQDWAKAAAQLRPNYLPPSERIVEGSTPPARYRHVPGVPSDVNHGSTYEEGTDDSRIDEHGVGYTTLRLTDEAAWWRYDDMDNVVAGFQLDWFLPETKFNALVQVDITVEHVVELQSSAESGEYSGLVLPVYPDENGEVPETVQISEAAYWPMVWREDRSGHHESPRRNLMQRFVVKQGVSPRIVLGHIFFVSALDGTVDSLTQHLTQNADLVPHLRYKYWYYTAASLDQEIRLRAYEIWQQRGGGDGHALDDWLTAEREFYG
jgi:hypothetical protein